MFALIIVLTWTGCTALQIAVLRWARSSHRSGRHSVAWQFAWVACAGAAFSLLVSSPVNPYEKGLGLQGANTWGSGVYGAWAAVLIAVFLVWHREGRHRQAQASLRLSSVQDAQLAVRRSLIESQLLAVQARIDPQHFFDTLDAIESLYRRDVPRAEALFDELVVFLRAALPSLDSASSMLAREFDLATACVRMQALSTGVDIRLAIDADRALHRLAFPPGLLLPLLRGILLADNPSAGSGPRHVALSVRLETGRACSGVLSVSLTAGAAPDQATLQQTRRALRALFGTAATLGCTPPLDNRVTTHLRIEHEHL